MRSKRLQACAAFFGVILALVAIAPNARGGISGTVTGPDAVTPVEGITVTAYRWSIAYWNEEWGYWEYDWMYYGGGFTDANGYYLIENPFDVESGSFKVTFDDYGGTYRSETFDDANAWDWGGLYIGYGVNAPGIDAVLQRADTWGGLSSVAGRITGADAGQPLEGIYANLYRWIRNEWELVAQTQTAADGGYTFGQVRAGTYRVEYFDIGGVYRYEYYNNVTEWAQAASVIVPQSTDVTGINASLAPVAGGAQYSISGTVTDGVTPLPGIKVDVAIGPGYQTFVTGWTGYTGTYEVPGISNGTYKVRFSDTNQIFRTTWWNGRADLATADAVQVNGAAVENINATLLVASHIAGVVRGVNGANQTSLLANASVLLLDETTGFLLQTNTDVSGTYRFELRQSGNFRVRASATSHLTRWYDGVRTQGEATALPITPPAARSDISFLLPEPGRITGRVLDAGSGAGLAGVQVDALTSGGAVVAQTVSGAGGAYSLEGLDSGSWRVRYDKSAEGYFVQYHAGAADLSGAAPVALTAPHTVSLPDAMLVKGGTISGSVNDGAGQPVTGAVVTVRRLTQGAVVGEAVTDAQGYYEIAFLPAASYAIHAAATGFLSSYYPGERDLDDASTVELTLGATVADIDWTLPAPAEIHGSVVNAAGNPVPGATVSLYDGNQNRLREVVTGSGGDYSFGGLWGGSYRLLFDAVSLGYISQWYAGKATAATADPVVIETGESRVADVVLSRLGTVGGTVRTKATQFTAAGPLTNIVVELWQAGIGSPVGIALSDTNGMWVANLAPGDYLVRFVGSSAGFYDQWYSGQSYAEDALPVRVVGGQSVTGIDAALFRPQVSVEIVSGNGAVTPMVQEVPYGANASITLQPDPFWSPSQVIHSNMPGEEQPVKSSVHVVSGVTEDVVVSVTFTPVPDVVPFAMMHPETAYNGERIEVRWTLTNSGLANANGPWTDTVMLSHDDQLGDDQVIGQFEFSDSLAPGEGVERVQAVTIPAGLTQAGAYLLIVLADAGNEVFEGHYYEPGETNNTVLGSTPVQITIAPTPDLVVSRIVPPVSAFSGQETVLEWDILNQGNGGTTVPVWYDFVYLSVDDLYDDFDILLAKVPNGSFLPPGGSYSSEATVRLPNGISGTHHLLVVPNGDRYTSVFQPRDYYRAVAFTATLTPPPDLQVTDILVPPGGFSGQPLTVTWTVENRGAGRTVAPTWRDTIYFSTNALPEVSPGDRVIGSYVSNIGELQQDEGYTVTRSFSLPVGISGDCSIKIMTDTDSQVFEHIYDENNLTVSPTVSVVLQGPDLEVADGIVETAEPLLAGNPFTISWEVRNYGTAVAPKGSWQDALYLSSNTTFDASEAVLLGELTQSGSVAAGSNYVLRGSFVLPRQLSGSKYLFVQADKRGQLFELDEANNLSLPIPITVQDRPADLAAISVSAPAEANAPQAVTMSWSVQNSGIGPTYRAEWTDDVFITDDPNLQHAGYKLASRRRSGALAPGASYTQSELVTLPDHLASGQWYLYVVADARANVYESVAARTNNTSPVAAVTVQNRTADLVASAVSGPVEATSGASVTLTWTASNQGSGITLYDAWSDRLVLSPSRQMDDPQTVLLAAVTHSGVLAPAAGYTGNKTITIPRELSGAYYFGVALDAGERVPDINRTNNIAWSTEPVQIALLAAPDLAVTQITASAQAISGQAVSLRWTVTNLDPAGVPETLWEDGIYLSRDRLLDTSDTYLGWMQSPIRLSAGQSYEQVKAFTIPAGLSGMFYVLVKTDRLGRVFEAGRESNNTGLSGSLVEVVLPPPADLLVTQIAAPASALLGGPLEIQFAVTNQGPNPVPAGWTDAVYLSPVPEWSPSAVRLEQRVASEALPSGASRSVIVDAWVPGLQPGAWHLLVRTDVLNQVLEQNEANNLTVSAAPINLDVATLELDQPETFPLPPGRSAWFRLEVPLAGEAVLIALQGGDAGAFNELYVSYGEPPSRGAFDFIYQTPFAADQEIVLPLTRSGTYYVLAYGNEGGSDNTATLTAQMIPLSIRTVDPLVVGDTGNATLRIRGARFSNESDFIMVPLAGGEPLYAADTSLHDPGMAFATFDLAGAARGDYRLFVLADDTFAEYDGVITVKSGIGARIQASIGGQPEVRRHRHYVFYLNYGNTGDTDAIPPLFIVRSLVSNPFGLSLDTMGMGPLYLLGGSAGGVAGMLRPGELCEIPIIYQTLERSVEFRLEMITADDTEPMDWDALESSIHPPRVSDAEWAVVWPLFQARVGPTRGDYVKALAQAATLLQARGQDMHDVARLTRELLKQVAGIPTAEIAGQVINGQTGALLAGVRVNAYSGDPLDEDTMSDTLAETYTDDAGNFVFTALHAGEYLLVVDEYALAEPLRVTVGPGVDARNLILHAWPFPEHPPMLEALPFDESDASLTRDGSGVAHLVWLRQGDVWHAWRQGQEWVGAQPLTRLAGSGTNEFCSAPRIVAGNLLLDGTDPGLVVTWHTGTGNLTRVMHCIGRPADGAAGYEWSEPAALTQSAYASLSAAAQVTSEGRLLVVFQRTDKAAEAAGLPVYDDTDLYFGLYDIQSASLVWAAPVAALAANGGLTPAPTDFSGGGKISYAYRMSTGEMHSMFPIIGGQEANLESSLEGAIQGNCEGISSSLTVTTKATVFDLLDLSAAGSGTLGYEMECPESKWQFKRCALNLTGSVEAFAPVACYNIVVLKKHLGTVKFGPTVGVGLSGEVVWTGGTFPSSWPDEGSVSMSSTLGGKADAKLFKDTVETPVDIKASVQGQICPKEELKSVSMSVSGEVKLGPFKKGVNLTWEWSPAGAKESALGLVRTGAAVAAPASIRQEVIEVDGGILIITETDTALTWAPQIGLGVNYGDMTTAAVLGTDILSAVLQDGEPSLARSASGDILLAWTREVARDKYGQDGNEVVASFFSARSGLWSAPVPIPGSLGFNDKVVAAFDGETAVVAWTHTDSSGLGVSTTSEEFEVRLAARDVLCATFSGGVWGAPSLLYGGGCSSELALGAAADGRLLAAWINWPDDGSERRVMAAFRSSGNWGQPAVVGTGAFSGGLAVGNDGADSFVISHIETDSGEGGRQSLRMRLSTYSGGNWLDMQPLSPVVPDPEEARFTVVPTGLTLPPEPEGCCEEEDEEEEEDEDEEWDEFPDDLLDDLWDDLWDEEWDDYWDDDDADDYDDYDDEDYPEYKYKPPEHKRRYKPDLVFPEDPNDILGPQGYGPLNWVRADRPLLYTIRYENDPEWATAAAQEVIITQELDSDLDGRSLRLGAFGWAGLRFTPPEGSAFYSQRLDLRETYGYFVDVLAFVDVVGHTVQWRLTTIDPATGRKPADPRMGFLLPNTDAGVGEGFVTYSVAPRRGVATGTRIDALASIIFDTENPLDTPAIFHTLDARAPTSRVAALPAVSSQATFPVEWGGADDPGGSGMRHFSVYVSDNGGPFTTWLEGTTLTNAPYTGTLGRRYEFYSVAVDNTGLEQIPALPERVATLAGGQVWTLNYTATAGGRLEGAIPQHVLMHQNGSEIRAVADLGFVFRMWDDGLAANPRVDTNATRSVEVTAIFDPEKTGRGVPSSWYNDQGLGPAAGVWWTPEQWSLLDDLDPDGDTHANWKEYIAGTLPLDRTSVFSVRLVSPQPASGKVRLGWPCVAGRTYGVYYRDSLMGGQWQPLLEGIAAEPPWMERLIAFPAGVGKTLFFRLEVHYPVP